ncbi:hypothetical protein GCM10010324_38710 [Streptomyces hiroshimensis]|uniref:Uncharacterized protein n=1 Tax=Streptomyces hiroshimensis TaxID=66424 RepID=A0ABQ2YMM2_9ACTN|nr:hypothetical protein GCM10010324_38710 [Streptomyces hiroshimensis]
MPKYLATIQKPPSLTCEANTETAREDHPAQIHVQQPGGGHQAGARRQEGVRRDSSTRLKEGGFSLCRLGFATDQPGP